MIPPLAAAVALAGAAAAAPVPKPDPLVDALLSAPVADDRDHRSKFFTALGGLARRQGLDPADYWDYNPGRSRPGGWAGGTSKGRAAATAAGDKRHVVAVLEVVPVSVPGLSAQQLVLLSEAGAILDKLGCGINSRYGRTVTEVLPAPAADGAVVVRFEPVGMNKRGWHNWHTVTAGGKPYTFYTRERDEPTDWRGRGLVRAAVADGKFKVVFPDLPAPDPGAEK